MRTRSIIAAASLALLVVPLGACKTVQTLDQALALANQNVGDFTIADERGWYYAEALYNVPASLYLSANKRFASDPHWLSVKAVAKPKLQQLNALRQAVYQAYKTGNAQAFREKIVQLKALSDQIRNIIPR